MTDVTEKGGGLSQASPDSHALPGEGDMDEHMAAVPFVLFHHHPAVAMADEQVILLPGQIFIRAAFTNTQIHPQMH